MMNALIRCQQAPRFSRMASSQNSIFRQCLPPKGNSSLREESSK